MMVSIVIPMYNASKTILTCIESVLNQTYTGEYEIIIVNDGSIDDSMELVSNYCNENNLRNVKVINKPNGGVSSARNSGMRVAIGKYIALLDSDDEWLPNKLARQIEIFETHPEIDFLGTNRNGENFKRVAWKKLDLLTHIRSKFLFIKFLFVVPTVIFKAKILADVGYFDENQKYAEEGNYFVRICDKYNCYLLNESLVTTGGGKPHFGFSGLSGNLKGMELGELKNLKDARKLKIINLLEYICLVTYSIIKYLRRIVIVKLRK